MDHRDFRNTLGKFATGVTVITTKNEKNDMIGLTANAFSSVSLDPPLILVCIDKKSDSIPAFAKGRPFAVNILTEQQEKECWAFAKKGEDKFKDIRYTLSKDGIPLLDSNLATIECKVDEVFEGGDHIIVTGLVDKIDRNDGENPLLFFSGKICSLNVPSS